MRVPLGRLWPAQSHILDGAVPLNWPHDEAE